MIVTQDERFAPRYEVELPVELLAAGKGDPIAARSVNLGAGGLCLEPGAGIADRTAVLCRLDTGGGALEAHGEVAWQLNEDGAYRVGIRFSALTPAMALWLASVSRTTSKASGPPSPAPESDTQPMRVPSPEEPEQPPAIAPPTDKVAAPALATRPVPKAAGQLSLPIDPTPPPAPAAAEDVDVDVVDSQVLFDDMPSPEVRMMRAPASRASVETVQASTDSKALQAFSPLHRLTAFMGKARRRGLALLAICRGALGGLIGAIRKPRRLGRFVTSATSRIRIGALPGVLKNRRVQLALAASAVVLLVGSGLFVLLSGSGSAQEPLEAGSEAASADPNRSYWDPPLMPAPLEPPADQEIVEGTSQTPRPLPAAPRLPASRSAPSDADTPSPIAAASADEIPLPEPPAIGEPEPEPMVVDPEAAEAVVASHADRVADTDEPSSRVSQGGRSPSRAAGSDERHESRTQRPASRAERHESRAEARADRQEPRAERGGRQESRSDRSDRHENRAEARSDRHENRAEARGDRHENRADGAGRQENRTVVRADGSARSAAPAPASPSTNRGAAGGAAPGTSDFRLNLSGAPGPIHTYPLANPNGIVIDVPELRHPGDATKLTSDDPRIRFVKILNRDTGVRFIVYVNGPLANYEVQPSGRGLRVAIAAAN